MRELPEPKGMPDIDRKVYTPRELVHIVQQAIADERERCAKLCDAVDAEEQHDSPYYGIAKECAAAIREQK